MVGIYKITSPTGRVYIGQSWNVQERIKRHKHSTHLKTTQILAGSFIKHGAEKHTFEIIEELSENATQSELDLREMFHIREYTDAGYRMLNLTEGGYGTKGYKLSEETKNKIRAKAIGRKHSAETCILIGNINRGKKFTEEHRMKISKANSGYNGLIGKKASDSHRMNISKALKGRDFSKEHRENLRITHQGLNVKCVFQYNLAGVFIKEWNSVKEAGDALKIARCGISLCANSKQKTAGKFIWSYSKFDIYKTKF
jgi:group I intron endonuclease